MQEAVDKLYDDKENLRSNPIVAAAMDMYFGNSMPLLPFPAMESCLGIKSKDSDISNKEGFVQIAYQYEVDTANSNCLFDMDNAKKH